MNPDPVARLLYVLLLYPIPTPAVSASGVRVSRAAVSGEGSFKVVFWKKLRPTCSQWPCSLPQRKGEQRVPSRYRDVLFAIHSIRDRPRCYHSAERCLPQYGPGTGVQGIEKPFSPAAENHVRRGAQDAAAGYVGHFELPLSFAV